MTQEELERKLSFIRYSHKPSELKLEWIDKDEFGFSRTLQVTTEYGFIFKIV